jgi:SM-20-related protein
MAGLALRLNPAIDVEAAARAYARDGFVQIPDVFEPEVAEALGALLETAIDWDLAFEGEDGRPAVLTRAQIAALGEPALRERLTAMMTRAGEGYGFLYLSYPLISAYLAGRDPGHPIHGVTEWLNAEFVRFGAAVTGQPAIVKADGQATRYRPGDFIGLHNDVGSEASERLTAYTLGLTRRWRPDWGGQLLFHDPEGEVIHGHAPRWNALTLFRVPQMHSVAPVAAYARGARLSIVGWLRNAGSPAR